MMESILKREDLQRLLSGIGSIDERSKEEARKRWNQLAKPIYGLGQMEDILCRIAGIQASPRISIGKKALLVMCADNGVVSEGISQAEAGVTAVVSKSMADAKASINIMADCAGADVIPVDIGIAADIQVPGLLNKKTAYGTRNIVSEDAMSEGELLEAIYTGIDMVRLCKDMGYELIGCGEMGIGNTTTSAAILSVLLKKPARETAGRGAGLSAKALEHKIEVIELAIRNRRPEGEDILDVLKKLGGFDIAGLCGLHIGAALYAIPIVTDGIISLTAAYAAYLLEPKCADYMIASHQSREPQSGELLAALGLHAPIRADMGLGEGSGAVMLFPLLDMAEAVYRKLHSFEDIGIEAYEEANASGSRKRCGNTEGEGRG
ncbi:MAG: nicotinate-nucleotide--dimethylbenzimidazole phosphoribosyltransferase [Johnsonella sp.]|nr:nicotinate-nucleotide--dimethylbenzimidazole phosphoribosyltransferase [Johnsonella sp.]